LPLAGVARQEVTGCVDGYHCTIDRQCAAE
jgi:hypothetical protein